MKTGHELDVKLRRQVMKDVLDHSIPLFVLVLSVSLPLGPWPLLLSIVLRCDHLDVRVWALIFRSYPQVSRHWDPRGLL
jgi:hypothetical protein